MYIWKSFFKKRLKNKNWILHDLLGFDFEILDFEATVWKRFTFQCHNTKLKIFFLRTKKCYVIASNNVFYCIFK